MVTQVEQHVIKASDPRFAEIDAAAFAAKNLDNLGNYTLRQSWLAGDGYIPYTRLNHLLKAHEAFQALPGKVSQLVLKQLDHNWQSFFASMRAWREHYVVEIVYQRAPEQHDLDKHLIAGIDLGTDNLITLTSNQPGFPPVVVNGRGLKSINQYYNKERGAGQAEVGTQSTKRQRRLTEKRDRRIKHLMHIASRMVIDHLVMRGIGTLVIGYNPRWKQRVRLRRVTRRNSSRSRMPCWWRC